MGVNSDMSTPPLGFALVLHWTGVGVCHLKLVWGEGVSSVLLLGPEGSKFTQFMSKGPSKTIKNNCHYLEGKTEALELENPKSPRDLVFQIKPLCQLSDSSIAFISRHQVQVLPPRNTPYL